MHPDGNRVLFADNPARGDNVSVAKVIDRAGVIETVGVGASWGVLWAPDGESVWFSNGGNVFAARPGETVRRIHADASAMRLMDVDSTGRVLVAVASVRREMIVRAPTAAADVDLSWLDWSTPWILSDDGLNVVFEEGNDVNNDGYGVFMRGTDGSAGVELS